MIPKERGSDQEKKAMMLAREILEIGTLCSIHARDIPEFERYWLQLVVYYRDFKRLLPDSPRRLMLHGLFLLSLLSQNRIAEFHAAVELIESQDLLSAYIRHPIQLEQALMEGCYNKVWKNREKVPSQEYYFFIDILMATVRREIAACASSSYKVLPLKDAATLLFFTKQDEFVEFMKTQNWVIVNQEIHFNPKDNTEQIMDSTTAVKHICFYAKELERIV